MNQNSNSIVIIGPSGVGKTTVADIISKKLNFEHCESDLFYEIIFNEMLKEDKDFKQKLDESISKKTQEQYKIAPKEKNWSRETHFELFVKIMSICEQKELENYHLEFVEWLINKHLVEIGNNNVVLDMAPTCSHYSDKNKQEQFRKLLSKFEHIFYLVPSEDIRESLDILKDRRIYANDIDQIMYEETNKYFIESGFLQNLATHILYTKNKTPEEIANVLLEKYKQNNKTEEMAL
ncbi:MAG: AAA family ATPase [Oscillospiraceae bacterium]|nr:AAA family ATPase [Oscillospiraceae bacterium]